MTTAQNFQFDASRITSIVEEIERQKKAKVDYVYPYARLGFTDSGKLVFNGTTRGFQVKDRTFAEWSDAERYIDDARAAGVEEACDWGIVVTDGCPTLPVAKQALSQLLSRMNVPSKFYQYLQGNEHGDIAGHVLRELMQRDSRTAFVRTLDGRVRAILSDRYKVIDNADLFFCAADTFKENGAQLWNARLWDDGFELFGVAPHIAGEVTTDRTFDPGDGWQSRWYGGEGDVHNPAVRISNSETGRGGLSVDICIMRRVCANFCVWTDGVSKIHAGGKLQADEGKLIVSDRTRTLEGELLWSTIRDAISTSFNEQRFRELMDALNHCTQQELPDPQRAVDNVAKEYGISDERKSRVLAELLASHDNSRFGLVQAVTATAHTAGDDAAGAFEEAGAALVEMADSKFAALVAAD